MTECTERSEGREGMPVGFRVMCGHHGGKAV
jgi:hypothetical protein